MAVRSSQDAIAALWTVIDHPVRPEGLLRSPYLPEGQLYPVPSEGNWVWSEPPLSEVGGYGDPTSYVRELSTDPESPLWKSPDEVLSSADGPGAAMYCQRSVDLTMRGGTTSGVIYPLAVCEIARRRRVRNVGGASAGAIAAALTGAAELGRSSMLPPHHYNPLSPHDRTEGLVRPGFVGLADAISWLCQLTPDRTEQPSPKQTRTRRDDDEYRLAQLFRPSVKDRPVFAFLTAAMRRQVWAMPVTALLAFGWLSRLLLAVVILGAVAVTAIVGAGLGSWPALDRPVAGGQNWWEPVPLAWAAMDLGLFFIGIAGLLVLLPGLRRPKRSGQAVPAWLNLLSQFTSSYEQADRRKSLAGRVIGAGLLVGTPAALAIAGWWHWTAGVLVGAGLSAVVAVVVAASVWTYASRASDHRYGLLAGAAPRRARRSLSERIAGTAKPTVSLAVIPWLSSCLCRLAALDDEVLRFGHLWLGRGFTALPPQPEGNARSKAWQDKNTAWWSLSAAAREAAAEPRKRLVNLELITTDLTRQRPYRFPLLPFGTDDGDTERLFFRLEDLGARETPDGIVTTDDAMFDLEVIKAMADADPLSCTGPGGESLTLHRLPDPWNLPVIFAVRLSLALPGLFKSVRLYRLAPPASIRDDLGRPVALGYEPRPGQVVASNVEVVTWPPTTLPATRHVEELWFSDGGITSNFPVHLFDAALPAWPTFGLNLGPHPEGFPHQDVWLPQDWQASRAPATEVPTSMTSFFVSIVDTARSWHDNMQTGMPGSRGRVAWVRQRPDEGGANLYMPREVIASLALRGALAGARLTRRFDNETQWTRYRWLRLRTALNNLQHLRSKIAASKSLYMDLVESRDLLDTVRDAYAYDPYSQDITWFTPTDESFWHLAHQILEDFSGGPQGRDAGIFFEDAPEPHPTLNQTPPM